MSNSVHNLSFSSNTPRPNKTRTKFLSTASVHYSLASTHEDSLRAAEDQVLEENSLFPSHSREFSNPVEALAVALDTTPRDLIAGTRSFSAQLEATNTLPPRLHRNLNLGQLTLADAGARLPNLPLPLLLDMVSLSQQASLTLCEVDQEAGPVLRKTCFANGHKKKVGILLRASGSFSLVASRFCSSGKLTKLGGGHSQDRSLRRGSSGISLLSDIGLSAKSVRRGSGAALRPKKSTFALNTPPVQPVTRVVRAGPSELTRAPPLFTENRRVIRQMEIPGCKRLSLRSEPFRNLVVQENDDESSSPRPEPQETSASLKPATTTPRPSQQRKTGRARLSVLSDSGVYWLPANIGALGIQKDSSSPFRPKRRKSTQKPEHSAPGQSKPHKQEPVILSVGVQRLEGRLKFFDHRKRFGFILVEETQEEYFCHYDDFKSSGYSLGDLKDLLKSNAVLEFECLSYIGRYKKSRKAVNIRIACRESE